LKGRAVLPGMVNAHSHAFLRGLRGLGETYQSDAARASRRAVIEELIDVLKIEEYRNLSRMAFEEMLHHGVTTVGEFQGVHHDGSGAGYAFDEATLEAAAAAGIRLVMLCSYLGPAARTAGRSPVAKRLSSTSVETFCEHIDRLRERLRGSMQRIGVSVCRLSAVPVDDVVALTAYAKERELPLHLIVDAEPPDAGAEGASLEKLLERGAIGPAITLVHGTYTAPEVLRKALDAGAMVCLCPITVANAGEQLPDAALMQQAGVRIALGADANMRVSMNEAMRWLECGQRMRLGRRGVFRDGQGRCAHALWRCATANGAAALRVKTGRIAPGHAADLFAIDTEGLSLLGATPESLLPAFVFSADRSCITHTCVGGTWHEWEA
jgi:formimidoylglutamate deiminase